MKKPFVKVCGLTNLENIQAISALPVDMLGFIFYPPSPRFLSDKLSPEALVELACPQKKVGVFVNETSRNLFAAAESYQLDTLQLHGSESPVECYGYRSRFSIIKAFPIASASDFEACKSYEGACDFFLFDTKGPSHGGNGFAFDWNMLDAYSGNTPFILSGGIAPEDASKIKVVQHPGLAGIDINSRFESSPGLKNLAELEHFLQELSN